MKALFSYQLQADGRQLSNTDEVRSAPAKHFADEAQHHAFVHGREPGASSSAMNLKSAKRLRTVSSRRPTSAGSQHVADHAGTSRPSITLRRVMAMSKACSMRRRQTDDIRCSRPARRRRTGNCGRWWSRRCKKPASRRRPRNRIGCWENEAARMIDTTPLPIADEAVKSLRQHQAAAWLQHDDDGDHGGAGFGRSNTSESPAPARSPAGSC